MSDERNPANARTDAKVDGSEEAPGRGAEGAGGWKSQGSGLKILLFASGAVVAFAVVRCTVELAPAPPRIASVGVLRPSVAVPDGILPAPPDSIAALAARQMARMLTIVSGVDAVVVESAGEDMDAVATFSLTSSRGNVTIVLEISDAQSQVLARAQSEGPPERLYAIVGIAARRAAGEIWPTAAAREGDRR